MDYFTRYGLEFNPFIKNSKEILVDTSEYKETLFRLDYLAKTKGFGLLTGSAGRGKTTTIRSWAASLNPSLYKVIYSSLSTLTPNDFYRNLVRELGNEPAFKKPDNFRIIQEEITRLAVEKRKTPVIIIDEANYINNAILNDLKILFNFEMDSRDRAAILLAGLPKLNSTLQLQIHEPLKQRIVMNYNLEGIQWMKVKTTSLKSLRALAVIRSSLKTQLSELFSMLLMEHLDLLISTAMQAYSLETVIKLTSLQPTSLCKPLMTVSLVDH